MNYLIVFVAAMFGSLLESWKQTYPAFDPKSLFGAVIGSAVITYGFNFLSYHNLIVAGLAALLMGAGVFTLAAKPITTGIRKVIAGMKPAPKK